MIKFDEGQITDLLPGSMGKNVEMQCISYALQKQIQRIIYKADRTRTVSMIDLLPEQVLDILATELRTPYYLEDMNIATKRTIIKKTFIWHTKAGTPSAVSELIEIVFGEGKTVEWFEYDEPPYTPGTFDIVTNARMTEEMTEFFVSFIQRVKNTRSHIRRILIKRAIKMEERIASGVITHPEESVLNHRHTNVSHTAHRNALAATVSRPKERVTNSPQGRKETAVVAIRGATGAIGNPEVTIMNHTGPRNRQNVGTSYAAAVAMASIRVIILNGSYRSQTTIRAKPVAAVGMVLNSKITI